MQPVEASQQAVPGDEHVHIWIRQYLEANTCSVIQYLFDLMKKKIHTVWFFTTGWFSFPSSCFFTAYFPFFPSFFCALHLALLSDFLPSRLRRVAAAVWLHVNSILHQCDGHIKRLWERTEGLQGGSPKQEGIKEEGKAGFALKWKKYQELDLNWQRLQICCRIGNVVSPERCLTV